MDAKPMEVRQAAPPRRRPRCDRCLAESERDADRFDLGTSGLTACA